MFLKKEKKKENEKKEIKVKRKKNIEGKVQTQKIYEVRFQNLVLNLCLGLGLDPCCMKVNYASMLSLMNSLH